MWDCWNTCVPPNVLVLSLYSYHWKAYKITSLTFLQLNTGFLNANKRFSEAVFLIDRSVYHDTFNFFVPHVKSNMNSKHMYTLSISLFFLSHLDSIVAKHLGQICIWGSFLLKTYACPYPPFPPPPPAPYPYVHDFFDLSKLSKVGEEERQGTSFFSKE